MKILVLCLPAVGDGLMATPMVKALKVNFPSAEIDLACMMGGVRYVFKNNPNIDNVHQLSIYSGNKIKGLIQLLRLRQKKYDVSILTFPSYRREYHWVQYLIGAKKRIAHSFSTGYWLEFNFLNTDLVAVDEAVHNVINNLNLLYAMDLEWENSLDKEHIKYDLVLDKKDVEFGRDYINKLGWKDKNIVAIHPGSTNSPAALLRRWPPERYAIVAKYLIKKGYKVLVTVGPDEKEVGDLLFQNVSSKSCYLTNNNFGQDLGILNQVKLLLCNDNGFGHLANALGVKIVTLWASTNDKLSLPYNKKLISLIRPPKFIPWYRYILKRSVPKGVVGGMEMISVKQVQEAIDKILS